MLSFLLKKFKNLFYFEKNNKVTKIRDRDIEEIEKEYVIHPYLLDNLSTESIYKLLEDLNYDIISYDAGDVRNKSIIDTITQSNMTDMNVLSLLKQKRKPLVIVMDEIDGMNNGDKGGINSLIKLIRPKKTKKP